MRTCLIPRALRAFALGMLAFATAATASADELESHTPYYEDDAWYDVSEWLDGNDYNPTDEAIGRWDDEIYHAATSGSDSDNDTSGGYAQDDQESKDNDSYYDRSDNRKSSHYSSQNRDNVHA